MMSSEFSAIVTPSQSYSTTPFSKTPSITNGSAAAALAKNRGTQTRRRKQPRTEEEEQQKRQEAKAKARERKRKWRQNPENVKKEREAKKSRVAAKRNQEMNNQQIQLRHQQQTQHHHPHHPQQTSQVHLPTTPQQRHYTPSPTTPKQHHELDRFDQSSFVSKINQPGASALMSPLDTQDEIRANLDMLNRHNKDRERIRALPPDDRISHRSIFNSYSQPLHPQYPPHTSHIPSSWNGQIPMSSSPIDPSASFFMDSRSASLAMRPPPLPPTTAVAAAAVAAAAAALAVVKGTNQLAELDNVQVPTHVPISQSAPKNESSFFDDHWGMGYGGMPSRSGTGLQTHPLSTFISDRPGGGGPSPPRFLLNVIEEEYEKQQGHLVRHHGFG